MHDNRRKQSRRPGRSARAATRGIGLCGDNLRQLLLSDRQVLPVAVAPGEGVIVERLAHLLRTGASDGTRRPVKMQAGRLELQAAEMQ